MISPGGTPHNRLSPDAEKRLRRLRAVAWFLDRSIPLGGKTRIGADPLIGLIPVIGDWVGGIASCYILYEAMRLGLPWSVIGRMFLNVLIETLAGEIPVIGDVFDFVWQANMRNLRLVERHYRFDTPPRPLAHMLSVFIAVVLAWLALMVAATLLVIKLLSLALA